MTGWRLGWIVAPEDLVRPIECLAQNLFISSPTLSQFAAIKAFDCHQELQGHVTRYSENRKLLLSELPQAGFKNLAPVEGAFYIYADVRKFTNDSVEFCQRMLTETGVATTPGIDFDPDRGGQHIRFSFAGNIEIISGAIDRLNNWKK
jgi:aspartate/methionine/tyrosine aminotransferase